MLCHFSAKLNQSHSNQKIEEMIFGTVTQEFTTDLDSPQHSGQKQKRNLCLMPL